MIVDSWALFDTLATLHEFRDYRLIIAVPSILHHLESRDLDMVIWLPVKYIMSDAVTKRNITQCLNLNGIQSTCIW